MLNAALGQTGQNGEPGRTLVEKVDQRMAVAGAAGADQPSAGAPDAVDPVALLRRSAEFTGKLPRATLDLAYHLRVTKNGEPRKVDSSYRVLLGEGGRFAVGPSAGTQGPRVHSDGAEMLVLPPGGRGEAMRFRISHGVAALASSRPAQWIGHGLGGLTLSLLSPEASGRLLDAVESPRSFGRETIRLGAKDFTCHHGRVTTGELTWDFWVDAGERPLLRRIVPDLSEEPDPATPPEEVETAQITIDFDRWDLESKPSAGAFTVAGPPHTMLGKRPPPVTLPLVGGGTQRLEELIGKKVIVLDFWATWCPPCVASLPTLDRVVAEYADRGVVGFAINAGDDPDELDAFLAERDWTLPIARDADGGIGRSLQAGNSLPTSLIIGLDGRVQAAGVGVPGGEGAYRKKLVEELDALLAKKDLATETLAKWRAMNTVFPSEPPAGGQGPADRP